MSTVVQLFRDMGPAKLAAFAGAFIIVIIASILFSFKVSDKHFVPLYSNLDIKDSNKIVADLETKGIPYELTANGTQILVPEDKVLRLRMSMAAEGLPSKGSLVGYEIFDNSDTLGTSNFVQNVNLIRALEGELSRTIESFNNINSARVHLVMPKRELFIKDKQSPSASVVVGLKGSSTLSKEEINAISHLVATAVPGLELSKITIVDTKGRSLKLGSRNSDDPGIIASNSEEFRVSFENRLKNVIEELLSRSLGEGHVIAQVTAEINFDRIVTNSEIYDPESKVVRSVQSREEKELSAENQSTDSVSVANNIPNSGQQGSSGGAKNSSNIARVDETTNYEISKTIRNQISETGTVKRLSIAVLVDGTYTTDPKTLEVNYNPRSNEELAKLATLVKSAVGFDSERKDSIEVVNMQFTTDLTALKQESPLDWFKRQLPSIIQTIVTGTVVILFLLLVVRPIAIRAFEITREDAEELEEALDYMQATAAKVDESSEQQAQATMEAIETHFRSSPSKSINDIVAKHPEETLSIIRSWLNKE